MPSGHEQQKPLSGFHYVVAGATAGIVTRFLLQPLDVLKITFQLQATPRELRKKAKYTSLYQAGKTIYKEEGIFGLWKGHIPAQCLSFTFGALQFSTFEVLTSYYEKTHPLNYTSSNHFVNICCGSLAGLFATVASFPFDVIRTHLVFQGNSKMYKGTIDAMHKLYKKEGPRAFTRGLTAACIQMMPMSGLVFFFHGMFSQMWFSIFEKSNKNKEQTELSTAGSITTGLLAGICSKTVVYPFDLMKKRLQIQSYSKNHAQDMIVCTKISECFLLTVKKEGVLGLYKGITPTVIKSGATTSLYFTIYGKMCQLMQFSLVKR